MLNAQQLSATKSLVQRQQDFIDLRFGMFIHYNIPTYIIQDWADPEASPALFNPKKLDFRQWADAAKSANVTYGCLTTKHHSGFAIWDTNTIAYNVMNSPLKRDEGPLNKLSGFDAPIISSNSQKKQVSNSS